MILIVGGSGTLGQMLATRLLNAGYDVRVMSRTPNKVAALRAEGADVVSGDLLDSDSLVRACQGADAVVSAAHSILGRGRHASVHVDGAGQCRLIDAAKAAGVRRFVYVSVHEPDRAFRRIPFFRIKHDVEQYLVKSGLAWTILRPTAFMDLHAHVLIGEPLIKKGKVVLFGRGERPRNFVAASDVAEIAFRSLTESSFVGQTVDIGGPENLSSHDVVRIYERRVGRRARVTHAPIAVPRVMSVLLRPFHPGLSQIMQTAVLTETVNQSFDAGPLAERLGMRLMTLDEWVSRRL
ncbi:MAG TPA: SDR family oxidoreductase [Gemmatimonadaceae bacterium]|nr:SDR family oxidoreductase [Gemmatimonadaceae bacterium]